MTAKTRPEPGKLELGQRVIVRRSQNYMRGRPPEERYIPAVVVKVGRVWVDLESVDLDRPKTWRMRMDRQSEDTGYTGSNASFFTLEQHAWDMAQDQAMRTLRDHGIDLRMGSPWRGREIELADILKLDLGQPVTRNVSLTAEDYNAPLIDGSRHPLHGVPQEVLDAGRRATRTAAKCRDVEPSYADPIADAVLTEAMPALRAWLVGNERSRS